MNPIDLGMPEDIAAELRSIGARIETQRTAELYAPLQPKEPYAWLNVARDRKYGAHERNVLDVFTAPASGSGKPVVVFVHGGGFARGYGATPRARRTWRTMWRAPRSAMPTRALRAPC